MISQFTIDSTAWTPISGAGKSGTAWIRQALQGGGNLIIYHSENIPDDNKISYGYPLRSPNGNFDSVQIIADGPLDIFYARAEQPGAQFIINVDVV